ncbi:hypothetical protein Tco_0234772, partial [Tanacetum coccineum]
MKQAQIEARASRETQNHLRGNQRKWNNQKSQQLGKDFVARDDPWPRAKNKNITPKVVLLKTGIKPISVNKPVPTARTTLNVPQPKMTSFVKTTHSNAKGPFVRKSTAKKQIWVPKVPTVGQKFPTVKPTVAANWGNKGNAVKA